MDHGQELGLGKLVELITVGAKMSRTPLLMASGLYLRFQYVMTYVTNIIVDKSRLFL